MHIFGAEGWCGFKSSVKSYLSTVKFHLLCLMFLNLPRDFYDPECVKWKEIKSIPMFSCILSLAQYFAAMMLHIAETRTKM